MAYEILAAILAVIGAYLYGRHDGGEIAAAAQAREDKIAQVASEAAQRSAAEAIGKIIVTNKTIQGRVEKEIHENTIYTSCNNTPAGMRLVNSALTNTPIPAGDSKLPDANTTGRPLVRGDDSKTSGSIGPVLRVPGSSVK